MTRRRRRRSDERLRQAGDRLQVAVTDGRGGLVRDGGLARWLAKLAPPSLHGDVAVALVTDQHIRSLNSKYRGKDAVTDVLSFPGDDVAGKRRGASGRRIAPRGENHLGDIVIATGAAKRQARLAAHSYATELRVLALHGLLHLLGYDHEDPNDRGRMSRAEARLRRRGGLRHGLLARALPADASTAANAARSSRPNVRRTFGTT